MLRTIILAAGGIALSATGSAADWTLENESSAVSYVSIKNAATAEANLLPDLAGGIDGNGAATVEITLDAVETYVDIRNERMREILFNVAEFPLARVTADLDLATLEDLDVGATTDHEFDLTVAANGAEASYPATAWVTRVGEDRVQVASKEPVIVYADDLGYLNGLDSLREIAGLDSIQSTVPVTFNLVFTR